MTSFRRVYMKKKCTGKAGENKSPNNQSHNNTFLQQFVNPINNNKKRENMQMDTRISEKKVILIINRLNSDSRGPA